MPDFQTPSTEEFAPSLQENYGGAIAPGTEVILIASGDMVVVRVTHPEPPTGEVAEVSRLTNEILQTDLEEGDEIQFRKEHVHGIRTETTE